jgi:hypothetical protein
MRVSRRWGGTNGTPNPNGHGPRTQKNPDAVTQLHTAWPPRLREQRADRTWVGTVKVFAHDDTRLGFLPGGRRRLTASGVPPIASVTPQVDHFSLYGAVEPTPGASCCLALPSLPSRACQGWLDGLAAAFPASLPLLGLDHGAGHQAQAVRWPSNVVPVFLPRPRAQHSPRLSVSGVTAKSNGLTSLPRPSQRCPTPCVPSSNAPPRLPCTR